MYIDLIEIVLAMRSDAEFFFDDASYEIFEGSELSESTKEVLLRIPAIDDVIIREQFVGTLKKNKKQQNLTDAMKDTGLFYSLLYKYNLNEQWYAFQEDALSTAARDWCFQNNIAVTSRIKLKQDME